MKIGLPQTILARTLLALFGGLIVSQAISLTFYATDRTTITAKARLQEVTERVVSATRAVDQADAGSRPVLTWTLRGSRMLFNWSADGLGYMFTPKVKSL